MTENKGNSTVADATQFGRHMKHGGWELALLVARNVYKSKGSGSRSDLAPVQGKVTPAVFAKMAGVSARTVDYYYEAWQLAADRSDGACVTPAGSLKPGQDDSQSINDLVDEDDPELKAKALQELWSYFYRKAKGTLDKPKADPKPDDPKPVVEPPSSEVVGEDQDSEVDPEIKEKKEESKKEKADDGVKQNPKPKQDNKTPESNEVKLRGNLMAIRRTLASSIELVQDSDSESVLGYIEQVRDALDALEQYLKGGSMDDALKALLTEES